MKLVSTRFLYRVFALYLGLFSLATQISGSLFLIPGISYRGLGLLSPMRDVTMWLANDIFHVTSSLAVTADSGDSAFFWVQACWLLILSVVAAGVWTVMDRNAHRDASLHKWFRLFLRLALASQMFEYGMTKIIPTQFPYPSLTRLLEPVGDLPMRSLLWSSIGASPAYEIFTGVAELVGGVLLLFPQTALFGALICLADLTQVFVLNMSYDVGLKVVSFHLILMAVFLLAPDARRLWDFFFGNRTVAASGEPALFHSRRANRIALATQLGFGVYLLGMLVYANAQYWNRAGDGAPKSALYGIWNVDRLVVDGRLGSAELNDYDRRWRRVIFDSPDSMIFQRTDDSMARYGASINTYGRTITLTKGNSRSWKSSFKFESGVQNQLILDGEMDGHTIQLQLQLLELDTLRLLNSNFRWVRPPDP